MSDAATDVLTHAIEWAQAGGRVARDRLGAAVASRKADQSPVTDADHAVQALILDAIAVRYPRHAVLTEETIGRPERHARVTEAEWCWVIDPIDGTRNYARGLPIFVTSVAVLCQGVPVAGVVYDVMAGHTYSACAGGGAWRDGARLAVADNPVSHDMIVGAPAGNGNPMPRPVHEWLDRTSMRNLGATALHLAMVAAGCMDAAVCFRSNLWDIAAGALLVAEAGGTVTDLEGKLHFPVSGEWLARPSRTPYLAAGPNLHRCLLATWNVVRE